MEKHKEQENKGMSRRRFLSGMAGAGVVGASIFNKLVLNDYNTIIVDKEDYLAWKPYAKITSDIDEVIKSGGTKYSVCPVFKPLNNIGEEVD